MSILVKNIGELITLRGAAHKQGRDVKKEDLSILCNASFMINDDGFIEEINPHQKKAHKIIDAEGGVVLPGLIDSHTHLVFFCHRAHEYEMRSEGAQYEEIQAHGGGILFTVQKTREAHEDELFAEIGRA